MTGRNLDKPLILIVSEGATGSRASAPLDTQPLLSALVDEFDLAVLDTDDSGEMTCATHFGGGAAAIAGTVAGLAQCESGDLLERLDAQFEYDKPQLVVVQSGASSLYRLTSVLDAWQVPTVVCLDGWQEALSICRRWETRLSQVSAWVVDSEATADFLAQNAPGAASKCTFVIEPGSDLAPRFVMEEPHQKPELPLRVALIAGRSPHTALVRAERIATLLENVELHLMGVAPGASRQNVICHREVPDELLADALHAISIQLVEIGDGRLATTARAAALAAGAALVCAFVGGSAQLVRLHGIGWLADPADLPATAALLNTLSAHRFELDKGIGAARRFRQPSLSSNAAHLAVVLREQLRPV